MHDLSHKGISEQNVYTLHDKEKLPRNTHVKLSLIKKIFLFRILSMHGTYPIFS